MDRIADLTGDQYTYHQVQRIAQYYEELQSGAETSATIDAGDEPASLEYKIALLLSQRGVAIGMK